MAVKTIVLVMATATCALCQRPSFAGFRPIGYPVVTSPAPVTDSLGNRFGEDNNTVSTVPTTTQRLPVEANGDRELVDRLSKLPIDKQPFWLINWQALEANRKNPQTYPMRPSHFAAPLNPTSAPAATPSINLGPPIVNPGLPIVNPGPPIINPVPTNNRFQSNINVNSPTTPSPIGNVDQLGNRNGAFDNSNQFDNTSGNRFDDATPVPTLPIHAQTDRLSPSENKEPILSNIKENSDKKVPAIPVPFITSPVQQDAPSANPLESVLLNSQSANTGNSYGEHSQSGQTIAHPVNDAPIPEDNKKHDESTTKGQPSFSENKESAFNKNEDDNKKTGPVVIPVKQLTPPVHSTNAGQINPPNNLYLHPLHVNRFPAQFINPFAYQEQQYYVVPDPHRLRLGQRFGDDEDDFETHIHPHYPHHSKYDVNRRTGSYSSESEEDC